MRRAFTLIETIVAIIAIALLFGFIILTTSPSGRGRAAARQLKDSTQIRAIAQSLVVWTNSNDGTYPLPSRIDVSDLTVSQSGRAKDTTANIFSILIFNGGISPELCISCAESNTGSIQKDADYQYSTPKSAVDPANALWDPAFAADFTGGKIGNMSFAHLQPSGTRSPDRTGRLRAWQDSFATEEAIVANRGPEITSITVTGDATQSRSYAASFANSLSNTFLIHGSRKYWEGNVGYNDGHVAFETTLWPIPLPPARSNQTPLYISPSGPRLDSLFYDEPDDTNQSNIFLGIFTTAGEKPSEFKGIWD